MMVLPGLLVGGPKWASGSALTTDAISHNLIAGRSNGRRDTDGQRSSHRSPPHAAESGAALKVEQHRQQFKQTDQGEDEAVQLTMTTTMALMSVKKHRWQQQQKHCPPRQNAQQRRLMSGGPKRRERRRRLCTSSSPSAVDSATTRPPGQSTTAIIASSSSLFLSMFFLCLLFVLLPRPAFAAYSHYSAIGRPCLSAEFECGCGQPRCVPNTVVADGAADCADATDEMEETWEDLCGDGTPSRRSATWRTRRGTARLCPKPRARECPAELGQVCVEFDARPRCVCKLGYFRAPGLSACVPTEAFPHFDASSASRLADALRHAETTNCSRLVADLARLYPALFMFSSGDAIASNVGTKQRDELMGTDRQLTIRVASSAGGASTTRAMSPQEGQAEDGIKRAVPSTEAEQCDPAERTNGCGGDGRICAELKQLDEAGHKDGRSKNGTDGRGKGICVVPVNECDDGTLNDCDQKARCIDNDFGFECLCPEGFIDTSPNPHEFPGRKCRKLINECLNPLMNDCSPEAECVDELIGFSCRCKPGRSDISPLGAKRPGRKCSMGVNECLLGMHDCHPLATCVDLADGFRCQCLDGLINASPADQSGRNCTTKTTTALFESQSDAGFSSANSGGFFRCDSATCDPLSAKCVRIAGVASSVCRCRAGLVPLSATDDHSVPFRCGRPNGE